MIRNAFHVGQHGHLASFVIDPANDLLVYCCRFCGAHSQAIPVGVIPQHRIVEHQPACFVLETYAAQHVTAQREAA